VSLIGCATARKSATAAQLQIRVAHLESQVDDQEQEIARLQSTINELSQRAKNTHVSVIPTSKIQKVAKQQSTQTSKSQYQQILRVPVTPQEVQTGLKNAGYYLGAIDGKLGSGSKKAIKEFQTDHDLVSDGIIGRRTWAELKNYLD